MKRSDLAMPFTNSLPGMSGIIARYFSIAFTRAVRDPCISPSFRSPTRFDSFSSNWNESSSMESISSDIGFDSTTKDVPIATPLSGAATFCCAATSDASRTASAPEAKAWRRICAASSAIRLASFPRNGRARPCGGNRRLLSRRRTDRGNSKRASRACEGE